MVVHGVYHWMGVMENMVLLALWSITLVWQSIGAYNTLIVAYSVSQDQCLPPDIASTIQKCFPIETPNLKMHW